MPKLIECRNVTVVENGNTILKNINLSIGLDENVAILGPNGAGKSFFIKTITKEKYPLYNPDSYVRILGKDSWNVFELRSMLGLVSNDIARAHTRAFPVRHAILSGFFSSTGIWLCHNVTPEMEEKTEEVMAQMEITNLAGRNMNTLSTGEVQRVLIARALVHNPRALILDEPCNSLDFRSAYDLREKLRNIARAGTSIIMVTHDLTDIIPEITRVILLKDGKIFADGAKKDIVTSETFLRLFGFPLEIHEQAGYYHILITE